MVLSDLAVLAYAKGFTHWLYRDQTATVADVTQPGFLSPAAGMLEAGDLVTVSASDGTTMRVVQVTPGRWDGETGGMLRRPEIDLVELR